MIARPFDPRRGAVVLAAVLLLTAFQALAQGRLPTTQLRIGKHALKVEIAASDPARERGLMFREKMGRDEGMLFIFEQPAYHAMWMKNTLIPLSVAFVDAQGVILNIRDMEPHSEDTHMSAGPSLYAIETNRGWFAERGIRPGDKVAGIPGK